MAFAVGANVKDRQRRTVYGGRHDHSSARWYRLAERLRERPAVGGELMCGASACGERISGVWAEAVEDVWYR